MAQKHSRLGMVLGVPPLLARWWSNLGDHGRLQVHKYLGHLPLLMEVEPCRGVIEAAVTFWDEQRNVFRFNNVEMTPLLEEIGGFIEDSGMIKERRTWQETSVIVPKFPVLSDFRKLLGLTGNDAKEFIQKGCIPLSFLYERFGYDEAFKQKRDDFISYDAWHNGKIFAFIVSFLGVMVFPKDSQHHIGVRLIKVVEVVMNEVGNRACTLVPMILADIYRALGLCKKGAKYFEGCNLLVQLWFKEHLEIVNGAAGILKSSGINHITTPRYGVRTLKQSSSVEGWLKLFNSITDDTVQWMFTWFPSSEFTIRAKATPFFTLMGLRGFQPYIPGRVMRQAGRKQCIVQMALTGRYQHDYTKEKIDLAGEIIDSWKKRRIMSPETIERDRYKAGCEPHYVEWLQADLKGMVTPGPNRSDIIKDKEVEAQLKYKWLMRRVSESETKHLKRTETWKKRALDLEGKIEGLMGKLGQWNAECNAIDILHLFAAKNHLASALEETQEIVKEAKKARLEEELDV